MGFADGGSAAFEARQEAARRKTTRLTPSIPPRPKDPPRLSTFDQKVCEARLNEQEADEAQARLAAWTSAQDEEARVQMATLSREFSQRADALGHPALTFVEGRRERWGSEFAYQFVRVIDEGWQVSDGYKYPHDYDRTPNIFYVTREGPWIKVGGSPTIFGKGRGLPDGLDTNQVVAFAPYERGIEFVSARELANKPVEQILADEIARLERQSRGS
ncbi:hypothetical protein [Arthrobacter humicola]